MISLTSPWYKIAVIVDSGDETCKMTNVPQHTCLLQLLLSFTQQTITPCLMPLHVLTSAHHVCLRNINCAHSLQPLYCKHTLHFTSGLSWCLIWYDGIISLKTSNKDTAANLQTVILNSGACSFIISNSRLKFLVCTRQNNHWYNKLHMEWKNPKVQYRVKCKLANINLSYYNVLLYI
jgi:hypothetical protein